MLAAPVQAWLGVHVYCCKQASHRFVSFRHELSRQMLFRYHMKPSQRR